MNEIPLNPLHFRCLLFIVLSMPLTFLVPNALEVYSLLILQEQALLKPPVLQLSRDSTGRRFSDGGANIHLFMKTRKANGPQLQSQVAQQSTLLTTALSNNEEQVITAYNNLTCHSLLLSSYICTIKRKENSSCSACGHPLQGLTHLLLDCPASEPLRRAIFGTTSSIFDL